MYNKYYLVLFSQLITIDINDKIPIHGHDQDFVMCKITFFDKYTEELEKNLRKAAKVIGRLVLKCPLRPKHNFDVMCRHYKACTLFILVLMYNLLI